MPITAQNIMGHEWIGLQVWVKDSSDTKVNGLSGVVRDESRNTFLIETEDGMVRILKLHSVFVATLPSKENVVVDGSLLKHRPEDRVKRGLGKW